MPTTDLPLLHSPADVLRWVIASVIHQGTDPTLSPQQAWPVFASNEPTTPDNCVTVYDTAPKSDGRAMNTGEQFVHHGFQVRVRAVDHPTGYVKAWAIRKALDESLDNADVSVGGTWYVVHSASGTSVLCVGKDSPSSKRSVFTINGMVTLRRIA